MTAPVVLYRGEILLRSPLHVGQGHLTRLEGVNAMRRDGAGKPIIPGTALAGVFFEWMEAHRQSQPKEKQRTEEEDQQREEPEAFWQGLSGKLSDQARVLRAAHQAEGPSGTLQEGRSALRFASAGLMTEGGDGHAEMRDRVALDPVTRTVDEGKKFAQEQLAAGHRFHFHLEVETLFLNGDQPALLGEIEQVLLAWTRGFWLGGSSGAGNGWAQLTNLHAWHVSKDNYQAYLDAEDPFSTTEPFQQLSGEAPARYHLLPMVLQLEPQPDEDLWGRDFLEIHHQTYGAAGHRLDAPFYSTAVIDPAGLGLSQVENAGVYTIPGSTLRGAMRAAMAHFAQPDQIDRWFGQISDADSGRRGLIRFRDAYGPPKQEEPWSLAGHAEDEFTAGTFDQALYNRQPLLEGVFTGSLAVPTQGAEDFLDILKTQFAPAAARRAFSLGHGGGRPRWEFTFPPDLDEEAT